MNMVAWCQEEENKYKLILLLALSFDTKRVGFTVKLIDIGFLILNTTKITYKNQFSFRLSWTLLFICLLLIFIDRRG